MKLFNFETKSDEKTVSNNVSKNKDAKKQLKNHLDLMKRELSETNNKIYELKNTSKKSEWEIIDSVTGNSIDELREQGNRPP